MDLLIGKNIKALRTRRGITQETLAGRLGVAPQSVSKWERGEGYPDITFLIPLAEYFGVTLDDLMGMDAEAQEKKITERIREYEHYRHIGNQAAKHALIRQAYADYPFDFRIVVKYVDSLLTASEDIRAVREEIERLCGYVTEECTVDALRYDAISTMIGLYSECGEYDLAASYADRLPPLFSSKEFAMTGVYPTGDERDFAAMAYFIDTAMERVLWNLYCIAVQRTGLTPHEQLEILERTLAAADTLYPDFDCGICHSGLADVCRELFRRYSEAGDTDRALGALERGFRHEKALDDCADDVLVHTSLPLRGGTFDLSVTWDGCPCNGVWFMLERLNEPAFRFPVYDNNARYHEILDAYRPFAVEDKTK